MDLDAFIQELREDVEALERTWREEHARNPEQYPLEFPVENSGMWWEQFMAFLSLRGKMYA